MEKIEAGMLKDPLLYKARQLKEESDEAGDKIKDIHFQWEGVIPPHLRNQVKGLKRKRGEARRTAGNIDDFILEANNPATHPPNS